MQNARKFLMTTKRRAIHSNALFQPNVDPEDMAHLVNRTVQQVITSHEDKKNCVREPPEPIVPLYIPAVPPKLVPLKLRSRLKYPSGAEVHIEEEKVPQRPPGYPPTKLVSWFLAIISLVCFQLSPRQLNSFHKQLHVLCWLQGKRTMPGPESSLTIILRLHLKTLTFFPD